MCLCMAKQYIYVIFIHFLYCCFQSRCVPPSHCFNEGTEESTAFSDAVSERGNLY